MKNKIIALSLITFSFSALLQAGLVLENKTGGDLNYWAGLKKGVLYHGGVSSVYFSSTPLTLSITTVKSSIPKPLETYLVALAYKKKGRPPIQNGKKLVGVLEIYTDSIKSYIDYR